METSRKVWAEGSWLPRKAGGCEDGVGRKNGFQWGLFQGSLVTPLLAHLGSPRKSPVWRVSSEGLVWGGHCRPPNEALLGPAFYSPDPGAEGTPVKKLVSETKTQGEHSSPGLTNIKTSA